MAVKCNEVFKRWESKVGDPRWVCEAEAGTEHTHADWQPYMRPLYLGAEELVERDGCIFVVASVDAT